MGVPGFFSWLLRHYKRNNFILDSLKTQPKILYIDANCLFHPCCYKILEAFPELDNLDKIEAKMFKRIVNYIDYLVDYVNPTEGVYIAVDGVAPVAKINQQRKRRYRSIADNEIKNKLKDKYLIPYNKSWNNTVITPGTEFMEKLDRYLINHFKKRMRTNNKTYIYSSYLICGEGEHKILEDLRQKENSEDSYVIYGLDADLIFLAMSSQKNNIYLLREDSEISNTKPELFDPVEDIAEPLKFVSIDNTKEAYNEQIRGIICRKAKEKRKFVNVENDFCNDFIFLCYLLGNDFLPHFPSIDIKKNGLDIILDKYTDIYVNTKKNLITLKSNKVYIDNIILEFLLKELSEYEDIYFKEILPKHREIVLKRRCPHNDNEYLRNVWELENMRNIKLEDPIRLGEDTHEEYTKRYYDHYFGSDSKDLRNKLSEMYLTGLNWTTKYYYVGCANWLWQYSYNHAPFISDLYNYVKNSKININTIKFKKSESIESSMQLLCVIPPQMREMIPLPHRNLMNNKEIKHMFPYEFKLDMLYKDMYYQCIPELPEVEIEKIEEEYNKYYKKEKIKRYKNPLKFEISLK